jgi:hypothetical protein
MSVDIYFNGHRLETPDALMLEFLSWVALRPRTYDETMDAWRTNCPRFPVWEDAHSSGLVRVAHQNGSGEPIVVQLTDRARAIVEATGAAGFAANPE